MYFHDTYMLFIKKYLEHSSYCFYPVRNLCIWDVCLLYNFCHIHNVPWSNILWTFFLTVLIHTGLSYLFSLWTYQDLVIGSSNIYRELKNKVCVLKIIWGPKDLKGFYNCSYSLTIRVWVKISIRGIKISKLSLSSRT